MLKRFRKSEISISRLWAAGKRRLAAGPHAFAWFLPEGRINRARLESYHDQHTGERCFIIGNGPSLAEMNLGLLKDELTFGMNRVYLLSETRGFAPSYYVAVNELVLMQFADDIKQIESPKFLNWSQRNLFPKLDDSFLYLSLRNNLQDSFERTLARPLSSGGTVTYVALQLAFAMGFQEVILIGVDHNFKDVGEPNRILTRPSMPDSNHFHPDYFPPGSRWQLPDLLRSELAYRRAREVYEAAGRRIVDATVSGRLTVFPKVDYESLFK